jgi:hypothetical protein
MTNVTQLDLQDNFFLIDYEPMQARFAQERTKMPSKKRFEKAYGQNKNYQQPKYEVKTFEELRQAVTQIANGEMNHELYRTSNGLYRERMRTAQSTRDRCLETPIAFILTANIEQINLLTAKNHLNTRKGQYQVSYS